MFEDPWKDLMPLSPQEAKAEVLLKEGATDSELCRVENASERGACECHEEDVSSPVASASTSTSNDVCSVNVDSDLVT